MTFWRIRMETRHFFNMLKLRVRLVYTRWRYGVVFATFDKIDSYYQHSDIAAACEHIDKWLVFRISDAKLTEKYRREMLGLKSMLLMSGVTEEAITMADWGSHVLGLNAIDKLVSNELGTEVIDYIIGANLVQADTHGLCVWSANAASQIRHFILEKLFYQHGQMPGKEVKE